MSHRLKVVADTRCSSVTFGYCGVRASVIGMFIRVTKSNTRSLGNLHSQELKLMSYLERTTSPMTPVKLYLEKTCLFLFGFWKIELDNNYIPIIIFLIDITPGDESPVAVGAEEVLLGEVEQRAHVANHVHHQAGVVAAVTCDLVTALHDHVGRERQGHACYQVAVEVVVLIYYP